MIFLALLLFLLFIAVAMIFLTFLARTNKLSRKVELLEREVHRLRIAPIHAGADTTGISRPPETPRGISPFASPASFEHTPPAPEPAPALPASAFQRPAAAAPLVQPSRTREEWEALIGGKILNRIGALALILGVGFFLKYAFDNNWITETTRVLIGALIGFVLLLAGFRSNRKGFQVFAQGLTGAGVAILYLSVYASFNFYHLVPQGVAFVLMSVVTIITFSQAIIHDSLVVSLLGWLGGFLTPFLLSTGENNEAGLFAYIALLDLGLLAVVLWRDRWVLLEPLTAAATYFMYRLWYQQFYSPEFFGLTLSFLIIFAAMFFTLHMVHVFRKTTLHPEVRQVVAGANAILYFGETYIITDPQYHHWMGLATLGIGLIYLLTSRVITRRRPAAESVSTQYALFSIMFLIIATAIQFSGFTTVMLWSIEALLLSWLGRRERLPYVWAAALCIFVLGAFKLLFTEGALSFFPLAAFKVLLNVRALAFLTLVATLCGAAALLKNIHERFGSTINASLHYAWCTFLILLISIETNDFFRQRLPDAVPEVAASLEFHRLMVLALLWAVFSLPLVWIGLRRQVLPMTYFGLGGLALGGCLALVRGISFEPINLFVPLWNSRALVLLVVALAAVTHHQWLKGGKSVYSWAGDVADVLRVSIVLLVLGLLTAEARDFFQKAIFLREHAPDFSSSPQEISRLKDLQQLTLSGVWLVYSILVMIGGIWQRRRDLRIIAIILFGVAILKIFIYDLSFLEPLYRICSFVGLGVILLTTSYLYQRFKSVILSPDVKT